MRNTLFLSLMASAVILTPFASSAKTSDSLEKLLKKNDASRVNVQALLNAERREDRKDSRQERMLRQTLRGTLTSISDSTLQLRVASTTFSVDASSATFVRRFGGAMVMSDLQVNDELIVHGVWTNGGTLKAEKIQDLSLQARNGTFSGTVTSLSSASSSFVMLTNGRGSQTINLTSSTKITKNGEAVSSTFLAVGQKVNVVGVWNRTNENVTALRVAITVPVVPVHIQGTVTSLANDGKITLLSDGKTYTVNLRSSVLVFSQYQRMKAADIRMGDTLDVWARGEQGSLDLKAYFVRNLSQVNTQTHILTLGDTSRTLQVDVGDRIVLRLNNGYTWSGAMSSNATVLTMTQSTPTTFEAKATGTADITVNGDPTCRTATPACAAPSVLFRATVNVVNAR